MRANHGTAGVHRALFVACVAVASVGASSPASASPSAPTHEACGGETYRTRGVVRSFGPDRSIVNIAHEKIEGYMNAMTMTFEPRSTAQIASLKVGDRIRFTFTATEDGRRIIDSIAVD